jgi:hypothetical protein
MVTQEYFCLRLDLVLRGFAEMNSECQFKHLSFDIVKY